MAEPHGKSEDCVLSARVFLVTEWEDTLLSNGIQKAVAHLILTPFSGFF